MHVSLCRGWEPTVAWQGAPGWLWCPPGQPRGVRSTGSHVHHVLGALYRAEVWLVLLLAGCFGGRLWESHLGVRGLKQKIWTIVDVVGL